MKTHFIDQEKAVFWIIDMQEKLFPLMAHARNIMNKLEFLLKVANLLEIPIIVSEQKPEKLGKTIAFLETHLKKAPHLAKTSFSGYRDHETRKALEESRAKQIVLMGIESHICLLQTAKDLLNEGFEVIVPSDSTSSRSIDDHSSAMSELKECGVRITTSETIVYELLKDSDHPHFKTIFECLKSSYCSYP